MIVYEATKGLPRTVNVLCENALISGFAEQAKPVSARVVKEVAREFEFHEVREVTVDKNSGNQTDDSEKGRIQDPRETGVGFFGTSVARNGGFRFLYFCSSRR